VSEPMSDEAVLVAAEAEATDVEAVPAEPVDGEVVELRRAVEAARGEAARGRGELRDVGARIRGLESEDRWAEARGLRAQIESLESAARAAEGELSAAEARLEAGIAARRRAALKEYLEVVAGVVAAAERLRDAARAEGAFRAERGVRDLGASFFAHEALSLSGWLDPRSLSSWIEKAAKRLALLRAGAED
jgi:chromosome segregation ATPase